MIEKGNIEAHLESILKGTGVFLVNVKIDKDNKILVYVDKNEGVSIDDCVRISRALEEKLDRDQNDFALEVSSAGLDSPFLVPQQYQKNIGEMVSVKFKDGKKIMGVLLNADGGHIILEVSTGKKGDDPIQERLALNEILSTRIHIQF